MTPRTTLATGALTIALALTLTSCAAPAEQPASAPPASTSTEPTSPPATSAAPDDAPEKTSPPAGEPTCENIISEGTVDALESEGWTYQQQEFHIGETAVENGLLCMWADFETASDHGQMYGWGEIDAQTADKAMTGLQWDGWIRSTEGGATYFTEDPDSAFATDDEGFGMTYAFGEGWVRFADTKQGLLLIDGNR